MTWTINNNPDRQYVEVVFSGNTSWQDIQDLTAECVSIQKKQGAKYFLINTVEMMPTASVADVFQLPDREYQQQDLDRKTKIALIYSPYGEAKDIVTFYETACVNRGWQARCFTDSNDALRWLEYVN